MQCDELIEKLELLAPTGCACDWDNVGLLAGRGDKEVKKVFIALDATDEVVEHVVQWGADLLITHHPLIFKPLNKINDKDFISRRIIKLIRNDISYYAMHTNFDAAPGCMADAAADKLGLTDVNVLEKEGVMIKETAEGPREMIYGIGKTGYLKKELTVKEIAALVKERFHLPFVTVYGATAPGEAVRFVGISPGSGGSMMKPALAAGVKVLITGDIGHHNGIDAAANHMAVIDAGHYGLEYLFLDFMEEYLKKEVGEDLEICKAEVEFPETFI
ncbi:Nif3-like dinuclear metal center hexameric protein [Clostridium sp. WB02_MRS01]|uniref:Nif3-like dinuclear metal center hexameric protein n=1 Tax=Clostridium sp. WB02_MRS01 TaxID=2605777 RepID=UPI0012B229BA|nr:Nif3-like dinuclear metal center hexameric protein [Clostridium sp. WB02_MRS01]MSS07514.1 Nif3-like dinuclear metal center hexameric protein [Clostridium sp. WB02_MRS01]